MRQLNRPIPVGPVQAYKTYQVSTPAGHYRPASCAEVGCERSANGFKVPVPPGLEGQRRAHLIRTSGRPYRVEQGEAGVRFAVFPPGVPCFEPHRVQERPELYVVRAGDWRGNPTGVSRVHQRPADWVEDMQEHCARVAADLRKG